MLLVFLGRSVNNILVRLGKLFIKKEEPKREQKIQPKKVIIHPHYSALAFESDLALIHLQKDANYTRYVRPICLPLGKKDADDILLRQGKKGVVTGWGKLRDSDDGPYPNQLQKVTVPVVNQTTCKEAYKEKDFILTSNMFCAGYRKGGGDACQGDSGGPLAIKNSPTGKRYDRRWVLAGVVSFGMGCGKAGRYGVYTRVSAFSRWINDHINRNP